MAAIDLHEVHEHRWWEWIHTGAKSHCVVIANITVAVHVTQWKNFYPDISAEINKSLHWKYTSHSG